MLEMEELRNDNALLTPGPRDSTDVAFPEHRSFPYQPFECYQSSTSFKSNLIPVSRLKMTKETFASVKLLTIILVPMEQSAERLLFVPGVQLSVMCPVNVR